MGIFFSNKKPNRLFYNIFSKGKFRGPNQPGLTRNNYDNESYEPLPFEVMLIKKIINLIEIKIDSWN